MKGTLITEAGRIDADGRIWLPMDRIGQFCKEHPGDGVIVKIEVLERHSSSAMIRYYYGYVLPTCRVAFAKLGKLETEKQIDRELWNYYPGEHDPGQELREAPQSHVIGFLEWLKQFAAENLEVYIEDPKLL
jgi:hypothetical protein